MQTELKMGYGTLVLLSDLLEPYPDTAGTLHAIQMHNASFFIRLFWVAAPPTVCVLYFCPYLSLTKGRFFNFTWKTS